MEGEHYSNMRCPAGTGKTLLARAVASQLDCNFLKVVASAIVDKYIGESARLIREMFGEWQRAADPSWMYVTQLNVERSNWGTLHYQDFSDRECLLS